MCFKISSCCASADLDDEIDESDCGECLQQREFIEEIAHFCSSPKSKGKDDDDDDEGERRRRTTKARVVRSLRDDNSAPLTDHRGIIAAIERVHV